MNEDVRLAKYLFSVLKDADFDITETVGALVVAANTFHRLDVAGCNRLLTQAEETRMANALERVEKLAKKLGCKVEHGDPRGYSLHLVLPVGPNGGPAPSNNMGGDWGVR